MRLHTLFFTALFFISAIIAPDTLNAQQAATASQVKTLKTKDYTISYPAKWTVDQSGAQGTAFIMYMVAKSAKPGFTDNLNLMIQDLSGYNLDLQGFTDLSVEQLKQMIPGIKVVSNERLKNGTSQQQRLVFNSEQSGYKLKFEQRYWVIGKKAYVLTASYNQENAVFQEPFIKVALDSFMPLGK